MVVPEGIGCPNRRRKLGEVQRPAHEPLEDSRSKEDDRSADEDSASDSDAERIDIQPGDTSSCHADVSDTSSSRWRKNIDYNDLSPAPSSRDVPP